MALHDKSSSHCRLISLVVMDSKQILANDTLLFPTLGKSIVLMWSTIIDTHTRQFYSFCNHSQHGRFLDNEFYIYQRMGTLIDAHSGASMETVQDGTRPNKGGSRIFKCWQKDRHLHCNQSQINVVYRTSHGCDII